MNVLTLIWKYLQLKKLEAQEYLDRQAAAFKVKIWTLIVVYLLPFLAAFVLGPLGHDKTASIVFAAGLVLCVPLMLLLYAKAEYFLTGFRLLNKGLGLAVKKLDGDESLDEVKLVRSVLFKGFAWMAFVHLFYVFVPVWKNFVLYAGSLGIIAFVAFYIRGYPQDASDKYRKAMFKLTLAGFGGIIAVTFGLHRYFGGFGGKMKNVGVLGAALLFGIAAVACAFVSAWQTDDNRKKAFAVLWKVMAACAAVLAIWFGVTAAGRAVVGYFKSSDDGGRQAVTQPAPPPQRPSAPTPVGPRTPAPAPQPQPIPAGAKKAPSPGKRQVVVKKTPHRGDELDAVTDILDGVHNRREAAGM